jgi:hypothetical protein
MLLEPKIYENVKEVEETIRWLRSEGVTVKMTKGQVEVLCPTIIDSNTEEFVKVPV